MRILTGILARMFTTSAVRIDDAPVGEVVTIRGAVVPRDLIDSPLTGQRCVYYRYRSEVWRQSRVAGVGGDGFWELAETDEAIVEFYLADDSGRAIVSPAEAQVSRARGLDASVEVPLALPREITGHRRAHELLIEPGDELEVTGEAALVADLFDDGRDYRVPPQRLMLRAPAGEPLRIRLVRKRASS